MFGFSQVLGILVTAFVLLTAAGKGEIVWKGVAYLRYHAIKNAHKSWGCPSTTKGACNSYDPNLYK